MGFKKIVCALLCSGLLIVGVASCEWEDGGSAQAGNDSGKSSFSLVPCNQGLLNDFSKLRVDADALDKAERLVASRADRDSYIQKATALKSDAIAISSNYGSIGSCTGSVNGQLGEIIPSNLQSLVDLLDQKIARMMLLYPDSDPGQGNPPIPAPSTAPVPFPTAIPTAGPTSVPTTVPTSGPSPIPSVAPTSSPGGATQCDVMVTEASAIFRKIQDLLNAVLEDYYAKRPTDKTTTALRAEVQAFGEKHKSVTCSDGTNASSITVEMNKSLDSIDELIQQVNS